MGELVINRVKPHRKSNSSNSGKILINRLKPRNELDRYASKFKGIYDLRSTKNTFGGRCRLDISLDKLYDFFGSGDINNDYYKVVFYDDCDFSNKNYGDLVRFFRFLSAQKSAFITIITRHSNIPFYSELIKKSGFDNSALDRIKLEMINEFDEDVNDFDVRDLPCKLVVPTTMLNHLSLDVLRRNFSRIDTNYQRPMTDKNEILLMKRFGMNFADEVRNTYYFDDLTELEKARIVYNYIKRNVSYDGNATFKINNILVPRPGEEYYYASLPYGTLVNKRGICAGQAGLMEALLSNSDMNVKSKIATGKCEYGGHAWNDVIAQGKIYSSCLTMGNFADSLDDLGYVYDRSFGETRWCERVYDLPHDSMIPSERSEIDRSLKRKLRK